MKYAGDVTCKQCYSSLQNNDKAQLIDVRTMAEWMFVGVPDLNGVNKQTHTIEWQKFPTMQVNTEFVSGAEEAVTKAGSDMESEIYCLCRSGVRSIAAAQALTDAGFSKVYNVLDGFEGNHNEEGKRGLRAGWKFNELPWVQK